jgi:hypothetical protein
MQPLQQSFKRLRTAYDGLATNRVAQLREAHAALVAELCDPATSARIDQQITAAIDAYYGSCDRALRTLREDKRRDSFKREERIGRDFDYKAPPVRRLIDVSIRHLQRASDKHLVVSCITSTADLVRLLETAYELALSVYDPPDPPEKQPKKAKRAERRRCARCAEHAMAVCMLVIGNAPYDNLFPYSYSVTVGLMASA